LRHIILISGKDSLATALVQIAAHPELPYELIHNETGWDLPETVEWIDKVGEKLNRPILKLGDDLTEICDIENCLPMRWRRFCTRLAKIKPLNDYLGKSPATVYFGLRADEPDRIGYQPSAKEVLVPAYPLREHGIGINEVWKICQDAGLLPPQFHWEWMEDRVRELLGEDQSLLNNLPEWERCSLLAWRSRSNCDRCFYARQYERAGLFYHYPERYEDACLLEERLCHRDEHTWVKGFRLRDLIPKFPKIREKRAKKIVKYLYSRSQQSLFDESDEADDLEVTSCGLLCGK